MELCTRSNTVSTHTAPAIPTTTSNPYLYNKGITETIRSTSDVRLSTVKPTIPNNTSHIDTTSTAPSAHSVSSLFTTPAAVIVDTSSNDSRGRPMGHYTSISSGEVSTGRTKTHGPTRHPVAEDKSLHLIRLITSDYNIEYPVAQLEDLSKWSSSSPRNQQEHYTVSSQPSCIGYVTQSADMMSKKLNTKPSIPNIDPDDLTVPYAYTCTNNSDTYLIPYLSGGGSEGSARSQSISGYMNGRSGGIDEVSGGFIYYMLPVSKVDLHLRVRDIRQQGYQYACLALDICGYTLIATQSDDTTIFYFVINPSDGVSVYEVLNLESVCVPALKVLTDESQWLYGVVDPIIISGTMSLVQVNDYHYSAIYATNSYCSTRILKSFWGYFATPAIMKYLISR
nr:MAG: hypothetical protein [Jeilongvirus beilongi]